jgi:hypothetical protein
MTDTSEAFLSRVVERLAGVPGVLAVALGGSRARGWQSETSRAPGFSEKSPGFRGQIGLQLLVDSVTLVLHNLPIYRNAT